jgi:putative hydrolase of HD superfamily
MADRLDRQFAFLNEADKLKSVLRGTTLNDGSRAENSGEHSWHIALYALVLAEHSDRPVNVDRVIKMLLIHDIVEIDAGDNPIHGDHDPVEMAQIEQLAADRIFGLLPPDQRDGFRALWEEFEAAESDDAIFAKSIDRVQPVNSNLQSGGGTWRDYNVTADQLQTRVGVKVQRGAPRLWTWLQPRLAGFFEPSSH